MIKDKKDCEPQVGGDCKPVLEINWLLDATTMAVCKARQYLGAYDLFPFSCHPTIIVHKPEDMRGCKISTIAQLKTI